MQQIIAFPLFGGLDRITPAIRMPPGRVIASLNYEPTSQGYKRITGFERFDGHWSPSDALAYQLTYDDNGTGNTVSQFLSGAIIRDTASGTVIGLAAEDATLVSGTWGASTAVGRVAIWPLDNSTTPFTDNNDMFVGSTRHGYQQGSLVALTDSASQLLAAAQARAQIFAVTGSGPVRGVWTDTDGTVLSVRNNAGGTAGVFYKATNATGWVAVSLATEFTFNSGGTYEPVPGDSVTGVTSGAVGTFKSFDLSSGAWDLGTAAGSMWLIVESGTFQNGENLGFPSGAGNNATLTNAGTTYALPAGGTYEFLTHNFYGAEDDTRVYGVNGVGRAFEYDSANSVISPIAVDGMPADTPDHLAEHNGALFLSYPGGSIQFSTVGEPLTFNAILGAGEIGLGCDVTGLISATESALAILGENKVAVLYGHDSGDYLLETLNDKAGALEWSAQRIGQVTYLDNQGIRTLSSTAAFGNFRFGSLSQLIAPVLKTKRDSGVAPACSFVSRRETQYWLLFDDGTGLVGCFAKREPEFMQVDLGFTPTCACSVEIDGEERIFIGADDGFVYEFGKGTSFDGESIEHYLELAWNHFGAPQVEKRLHKFGLDLETSGTTTLTVTMRFDNGASSLAAQTISVTNGSGDLDSAEVYVDGVAGNVSAKIAGDQDDEEPHTLTGAWYKITARRVKP